MRPTSAAQADLVALVYCDVSSVLRGRALPAEHVTAAGIPPSVGWVPSAFARPPFGPSVKPNPFGSRGDLRLVADLLTRSPLPARQGETSWDMVLCDITWPDGAPWDLCPRNVLRHALDDLDGRGIRALVSFEQEFQLLGVDPHPQPLSLGNLRSAEPFPSRVLAALAAAAIAPEVFVAESGASQFEIPIAPAIGLTAPDHALIAREIVRATARTLEQRASFVPMRAPDMPPNGTHIHVSLLDEDDRNLFEEVGSPPRFSELGRRFAAGVLAHAGALMAITAPSPVSAARLRPGMRSGASVELAAGDREALLRIPPPLAGPAGGRGLRLEYRGADATANPYLALAMVLRAGLAGVDSGATPGGNRPPLPTSLAEALDTLEADDLACSWLPPTLLEIHLAVKRREVEAAGEDADLTATCGRYADLY